MRTHAQIITDAGGPHQLTQDIAPKIGGDTEVIRKRVWAWFRGDSIPGEYWPLIADHGAASVEELASAAEARKLPNVAAARQGEAA